MTLNIEYVREKSLREEKKERERSKRDIKNLFLGGIRENSFGKVEKDV